jgi:hypothetical protein
MELNMECLQSIDWLLISLVVGIVATYGVALTTAGVSIQRTVARSGDGSIGVEVALPAAKAGTLTTRTDNDTGVVTVGSGHGITDTDTVDLYWEGGRRYSVDVTATTATTISIDAGTGDNLPIATTAVTIVKQVQINVSIDGDALAILGISFEFIDSSLTSQGHALFEDASGDDIAAIDLSANSPLVYDVAGGAANPFTGDPITVVRASNGDSTSAATLKIVGVYDSTP